MFILRAKLFFNKFSWLNDTENYSKFNEKSCSEVISSLANLFLRPFSLNLF